MNTLLIKKAYKRYHNALGVLFLVERSYPEKSMALISHLSRVSIIQNNKFFQTKKFFEKKTYNALLM